MINYYGTKEEHLERERTGANIKRVRQNSDGIMLFAVITEHGVWPREGPVRFSEYMIGEWGQKYIGHDGYVGMCSKVFPIIEKEHAREGYDWREYWYFDDCAPGHRTKALPRLEELNLWAKRIPADKSGRHMADISPAENVWSWLGFKLGHYVFKNTDILYEFCKVCVRSFSRQQCLAFRAIRVTLYKVHAMVRKGGAQVRRKDYAKLLPGSKVKVNVGHEECLWAKHMNCCAASGCGLPDCPKSKPERIESLRLYGWREDDCPVRGGSNLHLKVVDHMVTGDARE